MFLEQALHTLKSHQQKITKTRLWIVEQLATITTPITAYELLEHNTQDSIDITTIYRNLEMFESLSIIHKIHSLGWYMPCTHNHPECHTMHDLIICKDCNTISETHIDINTKQTLWLSEGPVELNGHCTSCAQKK